MGLFSFIPKIFGNANERLQDSYTSDSEVGRRGTEASQQRALYDRLTPSYDLYSTIIDIRKMDEEDGIVKQIHNRTAKALTKGGLMLENPDSNEKLDKLWTNFQRRCQLNNRLKLISDAKGLIIEGSLPMQWVLDKDKKNVVRCIRMPTETIRPIVGIDGQFENPKKAYSQYNYIEGRDIANFARWQLDVVRLDPDNFDDMGALGRPMLDATRKRWRQIMLTHDDIVTRRHVRASQRTAHTLPGMDKTKLAEYKRLVEADEKAGLTNNYYMNTDGSVKVVEGDANLDQIADVALILDGFFAGTGMQKFLLGINTEGLSRDVLMDMKAEWYDELDILQDSLASVYEHGFHLEMLIHGMNPETIPHSIKYGERLTESLNQRTDRALKISSLGASQHTSWTVAGLDPSAERKRVKKESESLDPYPLPEIPDVTRKVSITPGNARNNESATSISNE